MSEHRLVPANGSSRPYLLLDVFAEAPLTGNPLAVFTDASGLSASQMQRAASELNLSETVFLERAGEAIGARIFTPSAELPFAGHPVLGAGFAAARIAGLDAVLVQTARAPVRVLVEDGDLACMAQPLPTRVDGPERDALLAALGVGQPLVEPAAFDNGPRHVFVLLQGHDELDAIEPDLNALAGLGEWLVSCSAVDGGRISTRTFLPSLGVAEDPATGSAAGPLAAHLCSCDLAPWGSWLTIGQGRHLGRPSKLEARASRGRDGELSEVLVRGRVVVVGEGRLLLPGAAS